VGQQVYAPRHRTEWLNKIGEAGVRRRAEFFYQQLDALRFTAQRSLALSGLVSGTSKMRSSHSISAMVCSVSIPSQYPTSTGQPSKGDVMK
jgi:hypothetical protein